MLVSTQSSLCIELSDELGIYLKATYEIYQVKSSNDLNITACLILDHTSSHLTPVVNEICMGGEVLATLANVATAEIDATNFTIV